MALSVSFSSDGSYKSSHSIVAVDAATGQMLGEKTVAVGARRFGATTPA